MLTGCGEEQAPPPPKIPVKAIKISKQDVPVKYEYPGQLKGTEEVEVHSRLSGSVVEKYFKGGDTVHEGDALYKIDSRQYETAILEAEANLHKAEAELQSSKEDLDRDEILFEHKSVSAQTLANQRATVAANQATVESYQAALRKAHENLDDTVVYAPMNGNLSLDDVAVGTYATAGTTKLVTIGATDKIYVQFSISETEYLNILKKAVEEGALQQANGEEMPNIKLILSSGDEYPAIGNIVAIDRGMNDNSNSLTIKAIVPNKYGVLLPGMFARVRLLDITEKDVLIVPQRAVQQLLDESFVLVVGKDGKSVSKNVVLGEKVGSYYIVKKGLSADDTVIVEGLTNLRSGQELDVTMVTAEQMGFSLKESDNIVNKS
ncbi:MAG: efflux RND transporter periplasmic adaptor subunit [Selenomonadaceae bacterium]|nr:efflux RND transporter periplasmic adaptor subunit [Selenomonadaceae bacterium]